MNGNPSAPNGGAGGEKEFVEERVAFIADTERPDRFIARVSVSKTVDRIGRAKVEKTFRAFQTDDITRVLDYDQVTDPPPDGTMMHGEEGKDGMSFPNRHFCLRGGFLFYFDLNDVHGTGQSHYYTYNGPPIGVIPLDKCVIEFPPGGRRVFREHAQSNARNGYELVVLHQSDDEATRPPAFVVAETLGLREKWAVALKSRAKIDQPTTLRAVVFTADPSLYTKPQELLKQAENKKKEQAASESATSGKQKKEKKSSKKNKRSSMSTSKHDKDRGDGQENVVQEAVHEFGKQNFMEKMWIDNFFENNNDYDAQARCRQMEQWQEAIKKGLKEAVLEQYEYFVEASGEMTTMGREVVALKTLVETQVETIKEMKEIDFASALVDSPVDDGSGNEDNMYDQGARLRKARRRNSATQKYYDDDGSDVSSVSSFGGEGGGDGSARNNRTSGSTTKPKFRDPANPEGAIEIPAWFDDVSEEILAVVKESRYTDATDLWSKAKQELSDTLRQHEQPTDNLLTKKEYLRLQSLAKSLDEMAEITGNRLVESLRRKNEALKQASKRERSDPQAQMAPTVSPCCLDDDGVPLRLLVKLGKTQEAATAYSARRSLLLLESLHERPISGTGSVDLVIYAAQLSQSFFSCLANAVEGFLDLFLSAPTNDPGNKEDFSLDQSSIHSGLQAVRNLPAGALASIVLWCDAELAKFAAAFGGTRILGNLALSPPPREPIAKGPRVLSQGQKEEPNGNKDRQAAIEVAAQCLGQAFQYASENLDTVGLPLTPRLAECLRSRLKGCEAEVASLLDEQWKPTTLDWVTRIDDSMSPPV